MKLTGHNCTVVTTVRDGMVATVGVTVNISNVNSSDKGLIEALAALSVRASEIHAPERLRTGEDGIKRSRKRFSFVVRRL